MTSEHKNVLKTRRFQYKRLDSKSVLQSSRLAKH